jgi:hypothetical protein
MTATGNTASGPPGAPESQEAGKPTPKEDEILGELDPNRDKE